ncbi:TetR/AcrR family transcriptional regulator [Nonomuraea sp. SMC257]|uniref:TetR/AcrR family transcriptional regulator n=1 Tax=Nonomuraea montanisoli TaxID=2741721 RepID=A0A7Y6I2Q6_9ACTN|nr:TetR/AcrR family transcriptional regulator [Nonomuraea montanisoli]NUW30630.1 TetR/AcrR family transcriptional regulator [Nonomuraea montanisoli]
MAKPTDTRTRILAVARELFAQQGVRETSLREIADRLGITKPALYYHFASREDLVRSIVEPMMDDIERFVAGRERHDGAEPAAAHDPRELLGDYFELAWRHRDVLVMVVRELPVLATLEVGDRFSSWRRRLILLLLGPDPAVAARIGATVALGGLSDCAVEYAHLPPEEVKGPAVEAAAAALGFPRP